DGGSVDAALRFSRWYSLHAMDAAFVLQFRISAAAFDEGDHFFQAADAGFRSREHLHTPALGFRIAVVEAKEFGSEQRSFVAAGAGTNFKHNVLLVVGIFGNEKEFQVLFGLDDALLELRELLLRVFAKFGIRFRGKHLSAFGDALLQVLVFAIF